jgi:hypothetical protein
LTNLYEHAISLSRENTILANRNIELTRVKNELENQIKYNQIENNYEKRKKLVALAAFLPVLADFIEDLNDQSVFRQGLKNKANMLVAEIEKADRSVLRIDEQHAEQVWKEQVDLQRAFPSMDMRDEIFDEM